MTSKARPNPPRIIGREPPRVKSKLATNVNNYPRNILNALTNCGTVTCRRCRTKDFERLSSLALNSMGLDSTNTNIVNRRTIITLR
jgi:transcription initiation factor IIE alpha subunit